MPDHPMQPLELEPTPSGNVVRFKANTIIRHLVNAKIVRLDGKAWEPFSFPVEDREQFWQLLGYSVAGYGDLALAADGCVPIVRAETVARADRAAERLLHPKPWAFQDETGLGETGCNFCDRFVPCLTVLYWSICRECAAKVGPALDAWEKLDDEERIEEEKRMAEREKAEASVASEPLGPDPAPPIAVPRTLFCMECLRFRANCECPKEGPQ